MLFPSSIFSFGNVFLGISAGLIFLQTLCVEWHSKSLALASSDQIRFSNSLSKSSTANFYKLQYALASAVETCPLNVTTGHCGLVRY